MLARSVVIFSFAVCVVASIIAMAVGDGRQFLAGAVCLFASCLVYVPMLEELE